MIMLNGWFFLIDIKFPVFAYVNHLDGYLSIYFHPISEGMKLYISNYKVILMVGFEGVVPPKYFER